MNCINGELDFGENVLLYVMKVFREGSFCAITITDTLLRKLNAIEQKDQTILKVVICISAKETGKQVTGLR
jgi:hypothetical protein